MILHSVVQEKIFASSRIRKIAIYLYFSSKKTSTQLRAWRHIGHIYVFIYFRSKKLRSLEPCHSCLYLMRGEGQVSGEDHSPAAVFLNLLPNSHLSALLLFSSLNVKIKVVLSRADPEILLGVITIVLFNTEAHKRAGIYRNNIVPKIKGVGR